MVYENGEETVYKMQFFLAAQRIQGQSTHRIINKVCVKCLDNCKKSRQQAKCKHGRQKSQCKDCGGSRICERNKIKSSCKDCGGDHICEHNKRRSICKDFGGGQIYKHNKIRMQGLWRKSNL